MEPGKDESWIKTRVNISAFTNRSYSELHSFCAGESIVDAAGLGGCQGAVMCDQGWPNADPSHRTQQREQTLLLCSRYRLHVASG